MELMTRVPTDLLATGILPKTVYKSLTFKLQRRQLKQHSECPVHTAIFTDFSSLKIIIDKIVITLAKLLN
jgi:hypothetical protein